MENRAEPDTKCYLLDVALVVVDRHFTQLKTGKISQEQSFYISNSMTHSDQTLADAAAQGFAQHWRQWARVGDEPNFVDAVTLTTQHFSQLTL